MIVFSGPPIVTFIAPVTAAFSVFLGYLVYKQSQKKDAIAAQAGIATVESGTVGQVIDAMNKHNTNLQSDNLHLRERYDDCERQLELIRRIPSASDPPKT